MFREYINIKLKEVGGFLVDEFKSKYNVTCMEQAGFFWPMDEAWIAPIGPKSFDFFVIHRESFALCGLD